MKTFQLLILSIIFPAAIFGQSLTGLWVGTVSNDSTTIRRDQSFEIVLTQYKNKVYGYSRSTFIVNDSLFYIVKRVKGDIEGNVCEVKDDDIISYNFKGRIDKGVKMISTFRFDNHDSAWHLDGTWKTNETKKFYAITGKIDLKSEPDYEQSKILPHLEELKLANDVAFYKESKKEPEPIITIKPRDKETEAFAKDVSTIPKLKEGSQKATTPVQVKSEPLAAIQQQVKDINPRQDPKAEMPAAEMKKEEATKVPLKSEPMATINTPVTSTKQETTVVKEKTPIIATREVKKETAVSTPVRSEPQVAIKPPVIVSTKKEEKLVPVKPEPKKNDPAPIAKVTEQEKKVVVKETDQLVKNIVEVKPAIIPAATFIAERKSSSVQTVFFKSDSLELSLYDNGEIDGDTVSILLNGQVILAKQGLKASAIKKTIYITPGKDDSLTLVLYAENLGKYPPNTGLLVVHDGEDVYQVRFSADLQQNAAVIFKRKRK